jgi:formylglycine-generating enzyme required for sulfatase activity
MNPFNQICIWKYIIAVAFSMLIGASKTFANESSCKNPTELTLNSQAKMRFCDISIVDALRFDTEQDFKLADIKLIQMAQFEVTQLQYKTVTGTEPWKTVTYSFAEQEFFGRDKARVQESDGNPAVMVTYQDAQKFADALNLIDSTATYRLPTFEELAYAARAGTKTKYFWGDEMNDDFAFYEGNKGDRQYARKVDSCPSELISKKSPGYCANDFGLFHITGNVFEWTSSTYMGNQILYGGSWASGEEYLLLANEGIYGPKESVSDDTGFRLVRIPK